MHPSEQQNIIYNFFLAKRMQNYIFQETADGKGYRVQQTVVFFIFIGNVCALYRLLLIWSGTGFIDASDIIFIQVVLLSFERNQTSNYLR